MVFLSGRNCDLKIPVEVKKREECAYMNLVSE